MRTLHRTRTARAPRLDTRCEAALPLPIAGANDAQWFPAADAALTVGDPITGKAITLDFREMRTLFRALEYLYSHDGSMNAAHLAARIDGI